MTDKEVRSEALNLPEFKILAATYFRKNSRTIEFDRSPKESAFGENAQQTLHVSLFLFFILFLGMSVVGLYS